MQPIVGEGQYDLAIRQKCKFPPSMRNILENLYCNGSEPNSRFLVLEAYKDVKITVKPERNMNNPIIEFSALDPQLATENANKNRKEGTSRGNK